MPSCPAPLVLSALLASAAPHPARAVIIPSMGSAEADRIAQARSHQLGASHMEVVGIMQASSARGSGGTGVFLGYDAEGQTG
jgi:hypothetical protein